MFKILPFFVMAALSTSPLFSDSCCDEKPAPVNPDPCCISKSGHELKACQKVLEAYSMPANYDVQECWNLFISGDVIYWQAREDGLDYGVTSTDPLFIVNGEVLHMDFGWHPGFKIGLGMNFNNHDNWDLFAELTHIISKNNTNANAAFIFPSLMQPVIAEDIATPSAQASWSLIYNTVDLNLGRPFYSGKMLTLRPHVGLRGAWFNQHYNVSYLNGSVSGGIVNDIGSTKFDSWGVGPRLGVESHWLLGAGLRIFGDAAFSLLYTYYDVIKNENTTNTAFGVNSSSLNDKSRYSQVRSNLEAALGLGWGSYFDNNTWHVDLALGYEFQYWPNANGNVQFVDSTAIGVHVSGGDLVLHGTTFKLRLDF